MPTLTVVSISTSLHTDCVAFYMSFHTHIVCPTLNLTNGVVSYSSVNRDVGSVAIHTCHSGYRLSPQGGETRTCTSSIGWDGQDVTCRECILNFVSVLRSSMFCDALATEVA